MAATEEVKGVAGRDYRIAEFRVFGRQAVTVSVVVGGKVTAEGAFFPGSDRRRAYAWVNADGLKAGGW